VAAHNSVLKRHRQSLRRRERNKAIKSRIRTLVRKVRKSIEVRDHQAAAAQLQEVNRAVDKAVGKGAIKRNTASRWLSRLARSVSRLSTGSQAA